MHRERLSQEFEERRDHLRKLALGILGCGADADDAVQETWLRLARSDAEAIDNPAGWLTTVTSRVSLDTLRARHARCTSQLTADVAESVPSLADDRECEAVMAEMIGTTITVLLETLRPAERVEDAFAASRGDDVRIEGVSDPDAILAGPTFGEWLDSPDYETSLRTTYGPA